MNSESFLSQYTHTEELSLANYLHRCPQLLEYDLTLEARHRILERLFSDFWKANDEYRVLFFPNGFGEGGDAYKLSLACGDESGEYSPAQKGKACGHVFKKGES